MSSGKDAAYERAMEKAEAEEALGEQRFEQEHCFTYRLPPLVVPKKKSQKEGREADGQD